MKKSKKQGFSQYFGIINSILYGFKLKYALNIFLILIGVLLYVTSTFMTKVLIDCIQFVTLADFLENVVDPLTLFFTNLFGGYEFLRANLWLFSIISVTIALAMACFTVSRIILRSFLMTGISKQCQMNLFDHIEHLPYATMKSMKNGEIIQTCTRDEQTVRKFIVGDVQNFFYTIFLIIFSLAFLFTISWKMALISIIVIPILYLYSFFMIKIVRKRYRITDDSEAHVTSKIEENLSAVRLVKAFNNENYEIEDFENYLLDYKKKFIHWRKSSSFFFSSSDILVFSQIALSITMGIYFASIGDITSSTVVIAFSYVANIVWPVRDLATNLSNLAQVMAALDRMNIILQSPIEDIESGLTPKISGGITFDDVSFGFPDEKQNINVLHNINLTIKAGQTVAIMGKTGSGKSTLAYLITRLYDTKSGNIYIDGTNIKDIQKKYLRRNISMVLQEPFLFSKSIYSNINIANNITDKEEIFNAAKTANVHESIVAFKDGYDTQIGEKGVTLSGGQKQRVAIARSTVNKAPILIFDDSLSAVDTETDIQIRRSLKQRMKDSTTLIITHRIATAKDADLIVVLENNTISEIGTYDELLHKEGLFKRIADIQTRMQ
ncbi:MAG: ABC transporter ATP-binding protein [Bacilli bacterium]